MPVPTVPAPALALLLDSGVLDAVFDAVFACICWRRYGLDWHDVGIAFLGGVNRLWPSFDAEIEGWQYHALWEEWERLVGAVPEDRIASQRIAAPLPTPQDSCSTRRNNG